ncbi:hypothetical protein HDU81_006913 [Chytriomyces hyalinus]|nr:hypothetical protein HDU81_006913 [Chytriomyces hyalinus]
MTDTDAVPLAAKPSKSAAMISFIQSNKMFLQPEHLCDWTEIKSGAFGVLYKADYLGTEVAVKTFSDISTQEASFDLQKYIEREVDMIKDARHPNVVQFMGCSLKNDEILLVTEYVPGGNVKEWIMDSERPMTDRIRISISMDVAKAMAYLHSRGIIHRDLKSENLLVTENKRIKVCDFGFSRPSPTTSQEKRRLSFCGTDSHMAPEIILCIPFDQRVDVFSYGIIMSELAVGKVVEGNTLVRQIPGFGISRQEVLENVQLRLGLLEREVDIEDDDGGIQSNAVVVTPSEPDIGRVMKGFVDIALACADEDASLRPDWKTVMRKLKELDTEAIKVEKELGLITDATLVSSISMPSMFSLANASGNSSRIANERPISAVPLAVISENEHTEELKQLAIPQQQNPADDIVRQSCANKRNSVYSRKSNSINQLDFRQSSASLGRTSKSSNKLNQIGLQHSIPHKIEKTTRLSFVKACLKGLKCEACDDSFLKFGDGVKPVKCHECGAVFHSGCTRYIPPSCGLPKELRTSLFPANPYLHTSTSTLYLAHGKSQTTTKSRPKGMPEVFHGFDGDHFATQEFSDAVNPDIHPPTPPVHRKKQMSLDLFSRFGSSESSISGRRSPSSGAVWKDDEHGTGTSNRNIKCREIRNFSARSHAGGRSLGSGLDMSKATNVAADSTATLRGGASRDLVPQ